MERNAPCGGQNARAAAVFLDKGSANGWKGRAVLTGAVRRTVNGQRTPRIWTCWNRNRVRPAMGTGGDRVFGTMRFGSVEEKLCGRAHRLHTHALSLSLSLPLTFSVPLCRACDTRHELYERATIGRNSCWWRREQRRNVRGASERYYAIAETYVKIREKSTVVGHMTRKFQAAPSRPTRVRKDNGLATFRDTIFKGQEGVKKGW